MGETVTYKGETLESENNAEKSGAERNEGADDESVSDEREREVHCEFFKNLVQKELPPW